MLPALFSPVSQTCIVAPLKPISCPAVAAANRIMLGDSTTTSATCQALGGCWSITAPGPSCFYSDTNVTPSTCPFVIPSLRIDCGSTITSATACAAAGCCWHSALSGAIAGPSCYRSDTLKVINGGSTTVAPFVASASRSLSTLTKKTPCMSAGGIWAPVAGSTSNSCYKNPSTTGAYTFSMVCIYE